MKTSFLYLTTLLLAMGTFFVSEGTQSTFLNQGEEAIDIYLDQAGRDFAPFLQSWHAELHAPKTLEALKSVEYKPVALTATFDIVKLLERAALEPKISSTSLSNAIISYKPAADLLEKLQFLAKEDRGKAYGQSKARRLQDFARIAHQTDQMFYKAMAEYMQQKTKLSELLALKGPIHEDAKLNNAIDAISGPLNTFTTF